MTAPDTGTVTEYEYLCQASRIYNLFPTLSGDKLCLKELETENPFENVNFQLYVHIKKQIYFIAKYLTIGNKSSN